MIKLLDINEVKLKDCFNVKVEVLDEDDTLLSSRKIIHTSLYKQLMKMDRACDYGLEIMIVEYPDNIEVYAHPAMEETRYRYRMTYDKSHIQKAV